METVTQMYYKSGSVRYNKSYITSNTTVTTTTLFIGTIHGKKYITSTTGPITDYRTNLIVIIEQ